MTHWLTTFDPEDGEPSGSLCHCDIDDDHDGSGNVMFPLFPLPGQDTPYQATDERSKEKKETSD